MAYTALTAGDIVAGKPTKEEIFTQIRTNQESFNTDIEALKQTSTIDIFDFVVDGDGINDYSTSEINDRLPVFKAPVSAQMVSFVVTLLETSTSGTLSVEIDKSTDDGSSWSALLSSSVDLTGTTVGSKSGTVNWVDTPSQSFDQNDLLRLRITSIQTGQGRFQLSIYGEVA